MEGAEWRGDKGRKNWGNCNSIINKMYFKKKKEKIGNCYNKVKER